MRLLLIAVALSQLYIALAQSSSNTTSTTSIAASLTEIAANARATYPSEITSTLSPGNTSTISQTATNATSFTGSTTTPSTSATQTTLVGTGTPQNNSVPDSVKCNGYNDLCTRKYSNIAYVVAHNSPFAIDGNIASNQALDVTTQLNDGIRGLQFETHYVNDTVVLCHTSCDLLNAGTLEAYLTTVRNWLEQPANRFEVITILMGNQDYIDPGNYTAPVANSASWNTYIHLLRTQWASTAGPRCQR